MTYIYYQDHKNEWRWRLVAADGRIIADSAEGYENESECKKDIDRVKDSADAQSLRSNSIGDAKTCRDQFTVCDREPLSPRLLVILPLRFSTL